MQLQIFSRGEGETGDAASLNTFLDWDTFQWTKWVWEELVPPLEQPVALISAGSDQIRFPASDSGS